MNLKIPAAATAVLLCASLSACGGSKKLSRQKLATKAEAICNKAERDVKKVPQPKNITQASDASAYFDKVAPIGDSETSSLKKLKPDSDAKDDWNAFISVQKEASDLVDNIRSKADKKDASGLQDLSKVSSLGDRLSAAAKKAGVSGCS